MAIKVGGVTVIDDLRNLQNIANLTSGLTPTAVKTAAYTAVANDLVRCNSTAGTFTVTLPASPADGAMVGVIDVNGTFGTYAVSIAPGAGKTIEGDSTSLVMDMNGAYAAYVFTSATNNWRIMETPVGQLSSLAVNVKGGVAGSVHYQSATDTTAFTAAGTAGQVLTSQGASAPTWTTPSAAVSEVVTPTNVSPDAGATNQGSTPTLTGSAFGALYNYTMSAAQWQVSTDQTFATTLISTGDVAGTSITYSIPSSTLTVSTTYYWRVRYKDSNGVYSSWSTATSFATAVSFGPTIGQSYGGGYYAGKITDAGVTYYLIVAPKATGENSAKQYKTTNDAAPAAAQTLTNGPAATTAMNSATYPAAQFCKGLTIGGFSDWYLPARDELEVVYRNLKPTTAANFTSLRDTTNLGTGFGVDGQINGYNANSVPAGAGYTSSVPGQTTVASFITATGTEAFAANVYWSSTEFSTTAAWGQYFSNGVQINSSKNNSIYCRAVRRLPV